MKIGTFSISYLYCQTVALVQLSPSRNSFFCYPKLIKKTSYWNAGQWGLEFTKDQG
jgi:hypothetical protein